MSGYKIAPRLEVGVWLRVAIVVAAVGSMPWRARADESINLPTSRVELPMTTAERANLRRVLEWWHGVIEANHLELVPQYQAESYIQHNPNISTGRATGARSRER